MKYLNTYNESLENYREIYIADVWKDSIYLNGLDQEQTFKKYIKELLKNKLIEFTCDGLAYPKCKEDFIHKGVVNDVRCSISSIGVYAVNSKASGVYVGVVVEGLGKWLHGIDESQPIKIYEKFKPGKIEQAISLKRDSSKFGL